MKIINVEEDLKNLENLSCGGCKYRGQRHSLSYAYPLWCDYLYMLGYTLEKDFQYGSRKCPPIVLSTDQPRPKWCPRVLAVNSEFDE